MARPVSRMLFLHSVLSAAAFARANAGRSRVASSAMIATTPRNSINVKPGRALERSPQETSGQGVQRYTDIAYLRLPRRRAVPACVLRGGRKRPAQAAGACIFRKK